jgi:hypothetical protein
LGGRNHPGGQPSFGDGCTVTVTVTVTVTGYLFYFGESNRAVTVTVTVTEYLFWQHILKEYEHPNPNLVHPAFQRRPNTERVLALEARSPLTDSKNPFHPATLSFRLRAVSDQPGSRESWVKRGFDSHYWGHGHGPTVTVTVTGYLCEQRILKENEQPSLNPLSWGSGPLTPGPSIESAIGNLRLVVHFPSNMLLKYVANDHDRRTHTETRSIARGRGSRQHAGDSCHRLHYKRLVDFPSRRLRVRQAWSHLDRLQSSTLYGLGP